MAMVLAADPITDQEQAAYKSGRWDGWRDRWGYSAQWCEQLLTEDWLRLAYWYGFADGRQAAETNDERKGRR